MSNIVGRNQPCPCGSGKKYKHCCFGKDTKSEASNRNIIIWGGALAVGFIGLYVMFSNDSSTPTFQSDPTGQGSPGQVWSPEHGHWHDASGAEPNATPNLRRPPEPVVNASFTPQPGPAPPGKFWSTQHGHWHDSSGQASNSTINSGRPPEPNVISGNTPQPDGPVPDGKVWNAEHGHWHNADAPNQEPAQNAIPNWNARSDSG